MAPGNRTFFNFCTLTQTTTLALPAVRVLALGVDLSRQYCVLFRIGMRSESPRFTHTPSGTTTFLESSRADSPNVHRSENRNLRASTSV
jgi:hypothetical protein